MAAPLIKKININGGVIVRPAPFKPGSNPYSR